MTRCPALSAARPARVSAGELRIDQFAQFPWAEGLREIAIDANFLGPLALNNLVCCGQQYDPRPGESRISANSPANLDAIDAAGQHEIQENEIGRLPLAFVERALPVDCFDEVEIAAAKRQCDQFSQVCVVVDDEYAGFRHCPGPVSVEVDALLLRRRSHKDERCTDS